MDLVKDRIDPQKAKMGAPYNLDGTTTVQVRRWNNPDYRTRILELREDYIGQNQIGEDETLPEEVTRQVMARAMSEHVLVGWSGITRDGKEVPYSQEAAYEFLCDEGFEEEMFKIINASNSRERFLTDRKEQKVKKS